MPPLPTGPPNPVPTHVALKDELFTAADLQEEALSLLDLCLLHRLDLLHGQQALLQAGRGRRGREAGRARAAPRPPAPVPPLLTGASPSPRHSSRLGNR